MKKRIISAALLVALALSSCGGESKETETAESSIKGKEYIVTTESTPVTEPPQTETAPVTETETETDVPVIDPVIETEPEETEPPVIYVPPTPITDGYDYTMPIPECTAVAPEYFNDIVFIGDSRTKGQILYSYLHPIDFSTVSLSSAGALSNSYLEYGTCFDGLRALKGTYKAIYVSLGLNELGGSAEIYQSNLRNLITGIRSITSVPIIFQTTLPVTAAFEAKSPYGIRNSKQLLFNEALKALCIEQSTFYIDPCPIFTTADGTLLADFTSDGAHLYASAYDILNDYYCTHALAFQ